MRFGNASTTVTGTVTPASVNTRVMPHLRPTRPMAIVNPHTARSFDWLPLSLQQIGGLDTRDPRRLGSHGPSEYWRRHPRAPTSKIGPRILQDSSPISSVAGQIPGLLRPRSGRLIVGAATAHGPVNYSALRASPLAGPPRSRRSIRPDGRIVSASALEKTLSSA